MRHHEQNLTAQVFFEKVKKLSSVIRNMGTPLKEDSSDLLVQVGIKKFFFLNSAILTCNSLQSRILQFFPDRTFRNRSSYLDFADLCSPEIGFSAPNHESGSYFLLQVICPVKSGKWQNSPQAMHFTLITLPFLFGKAPNRWQQADSKQDNSGQIQTTCVFLPGYIPF